MLIPNLEYEATHSGAGRQHQQDVREEHEIAFTLLLIKTSSIKTWNSHKTHFRFKIFSFQEISPTESQRRTLRPIKHNISK